MVGAASVVDGITVIAPVRAKNDKMFNLSFEKMVGSEEVHKRGCKKFSRLIVSHQRANPHRLNFSYIVAVIIRDIF